MNLNVVDCTTLGFLLFKRVLETVKIRGFITRNEKIQIFKSIEFLTRRVLDEARQISEFPRQLNVPGVQNSQLEQKCTYPNNK